MRSEQGGQKQQSADLSTGSLNQMGIVTPFVSRGGAGSVNGPLRRTLTIVNQRGLHARASAKFVNCVDRFDASISVSREGQTVGGSSIMGLMMLAASIGSTIEVSASGPEAEAALEALSNLVGDGFGESE